MIRYWQISWEKNIEIWCLPELLYFHIWRRFDPIDQNCFCLIHLQSNKNWAKKTTWKIEEHNFHRAWFMALSTTKLENFQQGDAKYASRKNTTLFKNPPIPIRCKNVFKKEPSNDLLLFPKGPLHGQMDSLTIRSMRSWLMDLGLSERDLGRGSKRFGSKFCFKENWNLLTKSLVFARLSDTNIQFLGVWLYLYFLTFGQNS